MEYYFLRDLDQHILFGYLIVTCFQTHIKIIITDFYEIKIFFVMSVPSILNGQ